MKHINFIGIIALIVMIVSTVNVMADCTSNLINLTAITPYSSYGQLGRMVVGDFNNDGNDDIMTTRAGSPNTLIYLEGNGDFTFTNKSFHVTSAVIFLNGVGDFDNDSKLDVLGSSSSGSNFYIFYNNNFSAGNYSLGGVSAEGTIYDVEVGDLDGDSVDDFTACYAETSVPTTDGHLTTYKSNATARTTSVVQTFEVTDLKSCKDIALEDFDTDGDLDIVRTGNGFSYKYYENNNGSYTLIITSTDSSGIGTSHVEMAVYDFDGDGDKDILFGDSNGTKNMTYAKNVVKELNVTNINLSSNFNYSASIVQPANYHKSISPKPIRDLVIGGTVNATGGGWDSITLYNSNQSFQSSELSLPFSKSLFSYGTSASVYEWLYSDFDNNGLEEFISSFAGTGGVGFPYIFNLSSDCLGNFTPPSVPPVVNYTFTGADFGCALSNTIIPTDLDNNALGDFLLVGDGRASGYMIQASNEMPVITSVDQLTGSPICLGGSQEYTVHYTDAEDNVAALYVYCEGNSTMYNSSTGSIGEGFYPSVSCTYNHTGTFTDFLYIYDSTHLNQKTSNISIQYEVTSNPNCFDTGDGGSTVNVSAGGNFIANYFINMGNFSDFSNYDATEFDWEASGCDSWTLFYPVCPLWVWFVQGSSDLFGWVFGGMLLKLMLVAVVIIFIALIIKKRLGGG